MMRNKLILIAASLCLLAYWYKCDNGALPTRSRLDAPVSIVTMADYVSVRNDLKKSLSQDDAPRFVDALDFVMRQTSGLLSRVEGKELHEGVFCALVNRKTPREIILLGAILALGQCETVQLENESLQKGAAPDKRELFRLRAKEAADRKYYYAEIVAKYSSGRTVPAGLRGDH